MSLFNLKTLKLTYRLSCNFRIWILFFSSNTAVVGFVPEWAFSLCIWSRTKNDKASVINPEACLHDLLEQYCFTHSILLKVEHSNGNIWKRNVVLKILWFSSRATRRRCDGDMQQHSHIHMLNSSDVESTISTTTVGHVCRCCFAGAKMFAWATLKQRFQAQKTQFPYKQTAKKWEKFTFLPRKKPSENQSLTTIKRPD